MTTQTLPVTPAQAQALASAVQRMHDAQRDAHALLGVLVLGHDVPASATLAHIDADAGTLTFHVESGGADAV